MSASEHNFTDDVLISGEELRGYQASEDLTLREPVGLDGEYSVASSAAGEGDFIGVVLYDVASGEEVAIAGDDCEVRVEVSEAVSPGDELLPDGTGGFVSVATSTGSTGVAVAQTGSSGSGEIVEAYVFAVQGVTA